MGCQPRTRPLPTEHRRTQPAAEGEHAAVGLEAVAGFARPDKCDPQASARTAQGEGAEHGRRATLLPRHRPATRSHGSPYHLKFAQRAGRDCQGKLA
eukprot:scaffold96304_cov32-Tisochrysis_lutea.AAC.1